jgi:hypothetical protein
LSIDTSCNGGVCKFIPTRPSDNYLMVKGHIGEVSAKFPLIIILSDAIILVKKTIVATLAIANYLSFFN